jgi:hypothetical protein
MKPIEIKFDFHLAPSNLTVPLRATAILHHSDPYYVVKNFQHVDQPDHEVPILPSIEIKKTKTGSWVHCDSEKETTLSVAVGRAIDEAASPSSPPR